MVTPVHLSCTCGNVEFEAAGSPIACAVCYCDDCQKGSRQVEALPGASGVQDPDGGTPYVLYRKDRFTCTKGDRHLQNLRLRETSPTRRVVADCCNTAMFLDFEKGHWFSVYRRRFADPPPLQLRIQTRFAPGKVPDDIPAYSAFTPKLLAKLLLARLAMALGSMRD